MSSFSKLLKVLVTLGELDTLLDTLNELRNGAGNDLLLVGGDFTKTVDLLNTVLTEENRGGEERRVGNIRLNEGAFDNIRGTIESAQKEHGELSTSVGHGKGGRTSTILSLDNLIPTELNSVGQGVALRVGEGGTSRVSGEEGNNGLASMSTNNGDIKVGDINTLELSNEGASTSNVQGGNTEQFVLVVDTRSVHNIVQAEL